jgi:hypothetical protein
MSRRDSSSFPRIVDPDDCSTGTSQSTRFVPHATTDVDDDPVFKAFDDFPIASIVKRHQCRRRAALDRTLARLLH